MSPPGSLRPCRSQHLALVVLASARHAPGAVLALSLCLPAPTLAETPKDAGPEDAAVDSAVSLRQACVHSTGCPS